ncbi:hypothetical protein MBSD_n0577 [Mizugakiibacter sediminis]|uniref:DUF885 domain-containing protein n=2 Tax=Mizugakiibacter sediminis TaxID=1475481 RepID=A0A0K8QKB4_9GAMM|nr:DUF885 family protein [Mizugakiibacter sediminis]GAP65288.1 hypothetical protein MBSD_n0577 [Mizugakiibacter sediminis]
MKRLLACAALAALACAAAAPAADSGSTDADARFHALYQQEWEWRLQQFPTLADSVGDHRYGDRLPDESAQNQQARLAYWDDVLRRLRAIDPKALSVDEQVNYAVYRAQIENLVADQRFRQYEMPFNSDSAFWSDLGFMPRDQKLDDAADYRAYIARLRAVPKYFDDEIANMRAGLARGFTVPRAVLGGRDVSIANVAELKHAEDSTFYAPFKKMPARIPAAEQAALRAAGAQAIREAVIPAYARLLRFFREDYVPRARKTLAAEALPDGKAYYRQQIREYTTLDLAPDAIHEIGLDEVARIHAEMLQTMREAGFTGTFPEFLAFLRSDPQFYARTPDELLMRAAWIAKRVDGQLGKFFGLLPRRRFDIEPVPADIAPFWTSGRGGPDTYWVNTYDLKSRPLYNLPALTLHESAPGHSLQIALAEEQHEQPAFRRYGYISAFGEGWALYSEDLGNEMGIYTTPYERFGQLTYAMWRACRLVVDTGVHHLGWTRERAIAYLRDNTALSEHEVETEVDRYISWPGQALSYKLGELKILELRRKAEAALGPKFDLRAFHDTVLSMGSVPLPLLEQRIDRFIADGGKPPAPACACAR